MEILDSYKQMVKKVERHGNSGGIYLPADWKGRYVLVRTLSPREVILNTLGPYMKHIMGVYLHGSYARGEEVEDSDIDILIVADKKLKIPKNDGLDITVVTEKEIKKSVTKNPFDLYPMIKEARPILNEKLLNDLKKEKIKFKKPPKWVIETTGSALELCREALKTHEWIPSPVIYSLMMRLRLVYLVNCFLRNKRYTNADFKRWVLKKGLRERVFAELYEIYRAERDDRPLLKREVYEDDVNLLYEIVMGELKNLKKK